MNKTEQLNELFDEWRQKEFDGKKFEIFCEDGIVDEIEFENQNLKVAFLLKDANAEKPEESNVRNNLLNTANEESNFGKMWKVLCMWKRITEDPNISFKDCCDEKFEIDMSMCKYLKKIAVVNLAKEHGKGVNNQDELNNKLAKAVKQYYDYTQKELDIIEPDIVVCCGTYYHIRDQYENCDEITLPSGAKYFTNDKTKFIEMYHPGSYTGYPVLFAYFKEVYSNLK